jgi:allophanate hydrolase
MTQHAYSLDIASLHEAFRSGALTPEQLVADLYAQLERDSEPNVWITRVAREQALERARALGPFVDIARQPLFGIPFAVKDNIDVAGLLTTAACPAFAYLPEVSSPAVDALLRAGAICFGKVNMDQFATGLVGTRSPYGACVNVFDPAYLSGGSSSGSAVAVAAHLVSFALGTDTAGSGRVPAALNNIVGLKATRTLLPTEGMVPACQSLDCLSVFAACVRDAALVRDTIVGRPRLCSSVPAGFRFAVPEPLELFGDARSLQVFERALARLETLGGERVALDFAPFAELGDLLYGAFVIERELAVGSFIEAQRDRVLPVTRDIILSASAYSGADAMRAVQHAEQLRTHCLRALSAVDYLVMPTVPTHFTLAQDAAEPRLVNDKLGIYTRFVNFIGCPVLAVPQDFRADGLPFGLSLAALPGADASLDALADHLHRLSDAGMGRLRYPLPASDAVTGRPPPQQARLAVVGAHMRGLALNEQLVACAARYVATVQTAPVYRLFALPNSQPERPGLVRTPQDGSALEVELWDLSWSSLGALMERVPPPLAIGTLELSDGELVKGFLCESYAAQGARDISSFGGYRRYLERK